VLDAAALIRSARRRAGRSLRDVAMRAGTSHSTLATYERGGKNPTVATLDRILRACGYEARVTLSTPARPPFDRIARGQELLDALELADSFPSRHQPSLTAPRFGPAA
jgi:transcriptional regulator with XRE-family HTH domain